MKTFRKGFVKRKPLRKASSKAQSAMEYLMTYGWAILIISVVLAALFQLGVFNPIAFAPKAPPGSCQVFRPDGPYTTSFINLEGVCSGELPQYVAQFNGVNGYVKVPNTANLNFGTNNFTVVAWGNVQASGPQGDICKHWYYNSVGWILYLQNPTIAIQAVYNGNLITWSASAGVNLVGWHQIVGVKTGTTLGIYVDGSLKATTSIPSNTNVSSTAPLTIGTRSAADCCWMAGQVANVQIYNTSLSANEIQVLYLEGIGGAPIDLQHLVAWWPLNGNANDYSGNGNNGQINNVNFVSNWYNGYTPP